MFIDKRQIYSYFLPKIRIAPPAENLLFTKIDQDNDQDNDQDVAMREKFVIITVS